MTITEPLTTVTDYAIAAECTLFALLLLKSKTLPKQCSSRLWAGAFIVTAIAAIGGGTCHGFLLSLEPAMLTILWQITLYALSIASALLLWATVISGVTPSLHLYWLGAIALKCGINLACTTIQSNFFYAAIDYLSAMVIMLLLQLKGISNPQKREAGWFISGALVSGLAVLILILQIRSLGISTNALYHLVQIIALYLLFRGAQQVKDYYPQSNQLL